jgi:predicted RNA-binding protein YlqC (UPF0109 family)
VSWQSKREKDNQTSPLLGLKEIPEATNHMKELIEYIAKSIVNKPDDVVVTEEQTDEGILLKLQVDQDDMGRVIGKQGRVAQAMRTLLKVIAVKEGVRVNLEIG